MRGNTALRSTAFLALVGVLAPTVADAGSDLGVFNPTFDRLSLVVTTDAERPDIEPAGAPAPRHARRSRHHRQHGAPGLESFVQIKLGTFDPTGAAEDGIFFGLTTGVELDARVQLGFTFDLYRRAFAEEMALAEEIDLHGNVVRTTVRTLDTASTLIPLGVSLGFRLPVGDSVTPFIGVGVAYEILVNELSDFETGQEFTNVYGGPGWQVFGGVLAPLSRQTRFFGELLVNDAEVSRDIDAYVRGLPVRETIDVSGFGARLGLELAFD